jgi:hypothetical protein
MKSNEPNGLLTQIGKMGQVADYVPAWAQVKFALRAGWLALVGALVLAIAGFAAVQTIRLEGLKIWPLSIEGWKPLAEARQRQIDDMLKAQELAALIARSERLEDENTYREIAERIDDNAQADLAGSLRAADDFIAAGGMRAEANRSVRCKAGTGAPDHRAEDPDRTRRAPQLDAAAAAQGAEKLTQDIDSEGATDLALVKVSPADVRLCTINTVKAEAGAQLAQQLQAASASPQD